MLSVLSAMIAPLAIFRPKMSSTPLLTVFMRKSARAGTLVLRLLAAAALAHLPDLRLRAGLAKEVLPIECFNYSPLYYLDRTHLVQPSPNTFHPTRCIESSTQIAVYPLWA